MWPFLPSKHTDDWRKTAAFHETTRDPSHLTWGQMFRVIKQTPRNQTRKWLQPISCTWNSPPSMFLQQHATYLSYFRPVFSAHWPEQRRCITLGERLLETHQSILKQYSTLISQCYSPEISLCPFINLQLPNLSMRAFSIFLSHRKNSNVIRGICQDINRNSLCVQAFKAYFYSFEFFITSKSDRLDRYKIQILRMITIYILQMRIIQDH